MMMRREHFDFTKNKILIMLLWLNIESLFLILFLTLSSRSITVTLCLFTLRFLFFFFSSLLSLEKKKLFLSSFYSFSIIFLVNMMDSLSVLESEKEKEYYHDLEKKLLICATGIIAGCITYIVLHDVENSWIHDEFMKSDWVSDTERELWQKIKNSNIRPDMLFISFCIGASVAYIISQSALCKN